MKLYKAVSRIGDHFFSLGMAKANVILLPVEKKIDGGIFGIHASKTKSHAKKVICYAKQRKVLPIPPNMLVIALDGVVRLDIGRAVICNSIYIPRDQHDAICI